ncbi:MAG: hypothetical protein ACRCX2_08520 [Paraclostridium sp.]
MKIRLIKDSDIENFERKLEAFCTLRDIIDIKYEIKQGYLCKTAISYPLYTALVMYK